MKRYLPIIISIIILLSISIIYLPVSYRYRQLIFSIIGFLLCYLLIKIKFKYIKKLIIPLYILQLVLLIYVLLKGEFINGSRGWINFKLFSIQPSEITKISLILTTFYLISHNIKSKLLFLIIYLIPTILTFLEPDTGAVIIYGIIFLVFLPYFFTKKEILNYSLFAIIIIISLILLYIFKQDIFINLLGTSMFYRIDRLTSFINSNNIQINNALISIGSNKLLYFPEAYNDFFFSYVISQNSILFIPIILSYFIIIINLYNNKNIVSKILAYILLFQVTTNIGMNLNLTPVIGLPLPFFSYGGSHLITNFILLSLANRKIKV